MSREHAEFASELSNSPIREDIPFSRATRLKPPKLALSLQFAYSPARSPGVVHPWRKAGPFVVWRRLMSKIVTIKAAARSKAGKGASRSVRRTGDIPGVVYGDKQDPQLISLT